MRGSKKFGSKKRLAQVAGRLGRRRKKLRMAKYFGVTLGAVGAARLHPFSAGAGLLTAAVARVGERALNAWVFRRALGQPWVANKFKEKYGGNRKLFRALELMEWLGPYSPQERRRALLAMVRLGEPNMKELERRAAIAIEAKVTVALNKFEALGQKSGLHDVSIQQHLGIMKRVLPTVGLGTIYTVAYDCMDARGVGTRFIVVRRTAQGFKVTDENKRPRLREK